MGLGRAQNVTPISAPHIDITTLGRHARPNRHPERHAPSCPEIHAASETRNRDRASPFPARSDARDHEGDETAPSGDELVGDVERRHRE